MFTKWIPPAAYRSSLATIPNRSVCYNFLCNNKPTANWTTYSVVGSRFEECSSRHPPVKQRFSRCLTIFTPVYMKTASWWVQIIIYYIFCFFPDKVYIKKDTAFGEHLPLRSEANQVISHIDIDSSGYCSADIRRRLGLASSTMELLDRVWRNKRLSTPTNIRIYSICLLPVLLCGSETWTLLAQDSRRVQAFHTTCQRRILAIQWHDWLRT